VLSKGVYTRLDAPGADGFTVAQGINNAGQVVGQFTDADGDGHGFVLSKGVYTTIDVLGPLSQTAVFSVNAQGQIVGQFDDAEGVTHGYVGVPVR
jgi:probable HAF family extracellular repeat protein